YFPTRRSSDLLDCSRRGDAEVREAEVTEQWRQRLAQDKLERELVDDLGFAKWRNPASSRAIGLGQHKAGQVEPHGLGVEISSVMDRDTLPELEGVLRSVLRYLPRFRENALIPEVHIVGD